MSFSLLDFLFPRRCAGCGKFGSYLCNKCRAGQPLGDKLCPVCEKTSIGGNTHPACTTPLSLDGATFIFQYKKPVSQLLKWLKYKFSRELEPIIIPWTLGELKDLNIPAKRFTLIPIPLHDLRHNWRGFNQAEIIGKEIAKQMGWIYRDDILVRSRWRRPQTEVKKAEKRFANVRGIFALFSNYKLRATNYIIFDDVWTTGATIKEAAKVLKRNGAKNVWALTIAR